MELRDEKGLEYNTYAQNESNKSRDINGYFQV
jgi:hypothetical protein